LPNAISINPLNWKLDETYAPASQNLGSFMPNIKARRYEITDIGADAQVVLKRGVIVTNAKYDHPAAAEFFGPQSYHEDDYTFYYNNLKDNVAKRVAAYKEHAGAPDYSRRSCWYRLPRITKAVDTFFVYPTEYLGMKKGDPDYAPLDNPEMQDGVKNIDYKFMASAYRKSTNVFIPYYRQAGLRLERDAWKKTGDIRTALTGIPYQDITAALDCYFKKYNKGRPFILAGHSQGSAICTLLLKKYFKEHPEYYKRMVAAYIIGFSVTKDELEANPHLKFAAGETDTGVIVSWNTEGPRNVETNAPNAATLPNAISINPLNWKLDGTYAPPSENRGSLVPDEKTGEIRIGDLGADAQVVPDRGVIVTNARFDPMEKTELFGPQSFHNGDYLFYYNNLRDNVAKRIATYKARDRKEQEPDYSRKSCWFKFPGITKDVDTFYVYATEYIMGSLEKGAPEYATLDNVEMLHGVAEEYKIHATAFEASSNLFMPYYRQAGMPVMKKAWKKTGNVEAAISGMPYGDITAALDYYFKNCNNGRPFILAGHSQGSAIVKYALKNYFKKHPEYLKRMVAAYVIGYSVTKDELKAYPHLKFAAGETDTGVIISWNTEGPGNVAKNASTAVLLPKAVSINPLNWKRDGTYAPASKNLGSLVANEKTGELEIGDLGADAKVNLARGTVVTNAKAVPMNEEAARVAAEFFGPDGRHGDDYTYYYNNIKDNVAKRIDAYQKKAMQPK
ncbi:MAG: DUF3089 domain-containing protein, partial [Lentisphaeria bacterium]|nr:DUF3089 domain-containing protein [Lentisphaeria bacterium]